MLWLFSIYFLILYQVTFVRLAFFQRSKILKPLSNLDFLRVEKKTLVSNVIQHFLSIFINLYNSSFKFLVDLEIVLWCKCVSPWFALKVYRCCWDIKLAKVWESTCEDKSVVDGLDDGSFFLSETSTVFDSCFFWPWGQKSQLWIF